MRCIFPDALKPSGISAMHKIKRNTNTYWAYSECRAAVGQPPLGKTVWFHTEDSRMGHEVVAKEQYRKELNTVEWMSWISCAAKQNWIRMLKLFTEYFVFWGAAVSLSIAESDINYTEQCLFEHSPGCKRLMRGNCTTLRLEGFFFSFLLFISFLGKQQNQKFHLLSLSTLFL